MIKQINFILICIIIVFLNSCTSKENIIYVPVKEPLLFDLCHSEDDLKPVEYLKFSKNDKIWTIRSEDIKIENYNRMKRKLDSLYNAIQCYDIQRKNIEKNLNKD